jgi:hypothetical protein
MAGGLSPKPSCVACRQWFPRRVLKRKAITVADSRRTQALGERLQVVEDNLRAASKRRRRGGRDFEAYAVGAASLTNEAAISSKRHEVETAPAFGATRRTRRHSRQSARHQPRRFAITLRGLFPH